MIFKYLGAVSLILLASLATAQAPVPVPKTPSATTAVTAYIAPAVLFSQFALPAWPASGSAEAQADLTAVLTAQAQRQPTDVAEALLDAARGPMTWAQDAAGLGATFTAQRYPATAALLLALHEDMRAVNRAGNEQLGHRARPVVVDNRVKSIFADNLTHTASYPSARTASSRVWALLLAEVFPQRRAALLAHAERTAQLRLIGGAHFPSDISAGRHVSDAYFTQLRSNATFEQALRLAQQEAQTLPL